MHIEIIPEDYIINATMKCMWTLQSDFIIKAIRIKNDSSGPITVKKVVFEALANGISVQEIAYTEDALDHVLPDFKKKTSKRSCWDSKVMIGRETFWDTKKLSNTPHLESDQEIGLINEFFRIVHENPIDKLILSVSYLESDTLKTVHKHMPVVEYKTKNNYAFPVKGVWQVNGNYDCIGAHRTQYSMEFAFDLCQMNSESKLAYKDNMEDADYIGFGKDILAIADGTVVECFNDTRLRVNFPDDQATEEELEERKRIINQFGYMPIQCGNYVILKHDNGEYSLYGHLQYHSVTVKKGDSVKQGQPIGKLGNTGKSGCPHLHFQLMNGPDYSTARGLPCHFTNIVDGMKNPLDLIQEEYTIVVAES